MKMPVWCVGEVNIILIYLYARTQNDSLLHGKHIKPTDLAALLH